MLKRVLSIFLFLSYRFATKPIEMIKKEAKVSRDDQEKLESIREEVRLKSKELEKKVIFIS